MNLISNRALSRCLFFIVIIDTFLLLLFGKSYSKFLLIQPFFYVHDLILIITAIIALVSFNFVVNRIKSVDIFALVAAFYLLCSIIYLNHYNELQWYYLLRQFMVFGYMVSIYLILKHITHYEKITNYLYRSIIFIGILSVVFQLFYGSYLFVFKNINPFFERNYMSPLIVLGLGVSTAFVMVTYEKIKRQVLFFLVLILSFTTGHDSAYLSLILIYFGYYFFISPVKVKCILGLSFMSILIAIIIFVPTFTDVNMQWRIVYWKATLNEIFVKNYGVFGNGFGVPLLNNKTIVELNNLMIQAGHPTTIFTDDENYLTSAHNSFLSIMYHVGFIGVLLLIYPFRKCLLEIKNMNAHLFILFLSLIGVSVWAFFNVVLELPHSSSFYWLIYFTLAFMLKQEKSLNENKL